MAYNTYNNNRKQQQNFGPNMSKVPMIVCTNTTIGNLNTRLQACVNGVLLLEFSIIPHVPTDNNEFEWKKKVTAHLTPTAAIMFAEAINLVIQGKNGVTAAHAPYSKGRIGLCRPEHYGTKGWVIEIIKYSTETTDQMVMRYETVDTSNDKNAGILINMSIEKKEYKDVKYIEIPVEIKQVISMLNNYLNARTGAYAAASRVSYQQELDAIDAKLGISKASKNDPVSGFRQVDGSDATPVIANDDEEVADEYSSDRISALLSGM